MSVEGGHMPMSWRLKNQRYQLQGARDENGKFQFPPRPDVPQRITQIYDFTPKQSPQQTITTPVEVYATTAAD